MHDRVLGAAETLRKRTYGEGFALQFFEQDMVGEKGYDAAILEGMSILALLARSGDVAGQRSAGTIADCLERRAPFAEMTVSIVGTEGTRCIELSARPRFDNQGRFLGYRGVGSDVTEARIAADRIAHMARHDALTELPNRALREITLRETAELRELIDALRERAAVDGRSASR